MWALPIVAAIIWFCPTAWGQDVRAYRQNKLVTTYLYGNSYASGLFGHGFLGGAETIWNEATSKTNFTYTAFMDNRTKTYEDTKAGSDWTSGEYAYDSYGQIDSETRDSSNTNYAFDSSYNLTTLGSNSLSYSSNQLTAVNTTERQFSYNAQGARTLDDRSGTTNDYEYEYDPFGNLTQVQKGGSVVIYTADYDAFGRRFRWSDGTNTYFFLYDGSVPFAEFGSTGTLQRRIFWGQTGPICLRQSGNRWFIADKFGNTRALVDDGGSITDYYAYDAWGNAVTGKSSGSSYNPFRWNGSSGYQYVNQTTLYHVGAREYDPSVGRWLQRDRIEMAGRHPNLYVYVANNPVEMIDESGLQATGKISKIVFNGNTLSIIRTDGTVWKIPAYSGVAGSDKGDQSKSWVGPIPAGKYYVDPAEDQWATGNLFSQKWGAGYPYSDRPAWGDRKIPIKGGPDSGRGGFFLHGGDDVGSAGCVDIGPRDIDVIDWIGREHPDGSKIPFVVDYAGQTGKVPIHPGTGQAYSWEDWMQLLRKWSALKKKR